MKIAKTLAAVTVLAAAPVLAGPVRTTLVTDANTTPVVADSNPSGFYTYADRLYFTAWRADVGRQLFASDGTSPQEALVYDFTALGNLSNPYVLGRIGDRLIVSTQDVALDVATAYRHVVVALDLATLQSVRLAEFDPQQNFYTWRIDRVAEVPGHVLFTDLVDGTVWSTDGTAAGTQQRYAPSPLDNAVSSASACALEGHVVFAGRNGPSREIWTSDGTAVGTRAVAMIAESGFPASAIRAGAYCHFLMARSQGWALWRSDGTVAGTQLSVSADTYEIGPVMAIGDVAFVLANDDEGVRLYRSDQATPAIELDGMAIGDLAGTGSRLAFTRRESFGSPAGTRSATLGGAPLLLPEGGNTVAAGGRFYVRSGGTLYAVDPLTAAAVNLGAQPAFGNRWDIASLGPLAFDAADDGIAGNEPWRSDGTAAGTRRLHDIARLTADGVSVSGDDALVRDGTAFFVNRVYSPGGPNAELWRTDGTAPGTRALPHAAGSGTVRIAAFGDGLVFTSVEPTDAWASLYQADLELSGARLLWEPLYGYGVATTADAGAAVFHCDTPRSTGNLCGLRSTDLQAGVLAPGGAASDRRGVIGAVGNSVLVVHRSRLWRSDGTLPGTFVVAPDLPITDLRADPSAPVAGGALLFTACLGANGSDCGLHRSDGTASGTQRLAAPPDQIIAFAPLGNRQAFITYVGDLWITDGSVAGTRQIASGLGSTRYGMASNGTHLHLVVTRFDPLRYEYVVSDGTPAGTRTVPSPPGLAPRHGRPLVLDADTVVFVCSGPESGEELCRMDGSGNDWTLAADIAPGRRSSVPTLLTTVGRVGYFSADDGTHGAELWRVDPFVDALFSAGFE